MIGTVMFTDGAAIRLLKGKSVAGTIRLMGYQDGQYQLAFADWTEGQREKRRFKRTAHGHASMGRKTARVVLNFDLEEAQLDMTTSMYSEIASAKLFFDEELAKKKAEETKPCGE